MSPANSFDVFPAIDLLDGQSVRLQKGRRETAQVVHACPLAQLQGYARAGARWVHIVNLNAAFGDDPGSHAGSQATLQTIRRLVSGSGLKIQLGGGIRSHQAVSEALALGVDRIVIGTWAVTDFHDVMTVVQSDPQRFVIGVDSLGGEIAVHGWTKTEPLPTLDFAKKLASSGVRTVLFTEIERDGMLCGAAHNATASLAKESGLEVIASGGVRDLNDIQTLAQMAGVCGVITGRALAEGTLRLEQALSHIR